MVQWFDLPAEIADYIVSTKFLSNSDYFPCLLVSKLFIPLISDSEDKKRKFWHDMYLDFNNKYSTFRIGDIHKYINKNIQRQYLRKHINPIYMRRHRTGIVLIMLKLYEETILVGTDKYTCEMSFPLQDHRQEYQLSSSYCVGYCTKLYNPFCEEISEFQMVRPPYYDKYYLIPKIGQFRKFTPELRKTLYKIAIDHWGKNGKGPITGYKLFATTMLNNKSVRKFGYRGIWSNWNALSSAEQNKWKEKSSLLNDENGLPFGLLRDRDRYRGSVDNKITCAM